MLRREDRVRALNTVLMVVVTTILMLPVVHAFGRSIEPPGGLGNYLRVLTDVRLPRFSYHHSVVVSAGTILLTVACASLAGFAFSKLRFPFKNLLFIILLITLLVPFTTMLIPLFVLIRGLDLYNTYFALILPLAAFGVPFHTVLTANYLNSLPNELIDSARIDGCSDLGVFLRIMLPLSLPVQAVVIVLTFLGSWNNYILPLIMLKDQQMHTVPLAAVSWAYQAGALSQFGEISYDTLFAALFLLAAPTLIIFPAVPTRVHRQRHLRRDQVVRRTSTH